ncbi:ATP-binding cassette domain-containing protein [Liquorilactobacillus vini]|nr:ATP-binding cassette domain-containing protein [Liquorilactobacillus vini]
MKKKPIIKVESLVKKYRLGSANPFKRSNELLAVNNVSFNLNSGKILGVVGESGCGKSTLARMISRLIEPTAGKIFFEDTDITNLKSNKLKSFRKDLQMIFQDPYASIDPRKRIIDIMTEPLRIYGIGDKKSQVEKANKMLEKVGLSSGYDRRFPHELSGGQCQRVNIGRALMLDPKVIICDEPVSALDVSIQAQVINLLLDLQKQLNLTYIFISHDLSVVRYFCDDVLVINSGKIVERGCAEKIYENPQNDYTKKLLSAIPGKKFGLI